MAIQAEIKGFSLPQYTKSKKRADDRGSQRNQNFITPGYKSYFKYFNIFLLNTLGLNLDKSNFYINDKELLIGFVERTATAAGWSLCSLFTEDGEGSI